MGGVYKDQRRGINSDEVEYEEDEEEWTEVSYTRKSPQRQQRSTETNSGSNEPDRNNQDIPSFASVAAGSSSMQNRRDSVTSANFERRNKLESKFVTPAPEGGMRDEITVEVQTVNEKPFKGSLTFDEALNGIFVHCLELDTKILHGI